MSRRHRFVLLWITCLFPILFFVGGLMQQRQQHRRDRHDEIIRQMQSQLDTLNTLQHPQHALCSQMLSWTRTWIPDLQPFLTDLRSRYSRRGVAPDRLLRKWADSLPDCLDPVFPGFSWALKDWFPNLPTWSYSLPYAIRSRYPLWPLAIPAMLGPPPDLWYPPVRNPRDVVDFRRGLPLLRFNFVEGPSFLSPWSDTNMRRSYHRLLGRHLPPHQVFVFAYPHIRRADVEFFVRERFAYQHPPVQLFAAGNLNESAGVEGLLAHWLYLDFIGKGSSDRVRPPEAKSALLDQLTGGCGLVIPRQLKGTGNGTLLVSRTPDRTRGLFLMTPEDDLAIVALIDLDAWSEQTTARQMHLREDQEQQGLLFIERPSSQTAARWITFPSPFAQRRQALHAALLKLSPEEFAGGSVRIIADHFVVTQPVGARQTMQPVLCQPVPFTPSPVSGGLTLFLALYSGLSAFVLYQFLWGALADLLSVRRVIIGTFLIGSLLTSAGFDTVQQRGVLQTFEVELDHLQRELQDHLENMDREYQLYLQRFFLELKAIRAIQEVEALVGFPLKGENFVPFFVAFGEVLEKRFPRRFIDVVLTATARAIHRPLVFFRSRLSQPARVSMLFNATPVQTPFVRRSQSRLPLWPACPEVLHHVPESKGSEGNLLQDTQNEIMKDFYRKIGGEELYKKLFFFPERVLSLPTGHITAFTLETFLRWQGRPLIALTWFCDSNQLDLDFMAHLLTTLKKSVPDAQWYARSGKEAHRVPGSASDSTDLASLVMQVHNSKVVARSVRPGEADQPILQAFPGNRVKATLGGRRPTAHLTRNLQQQRFWSRVSLGVLFLFIALIAWANASAFLQPLHMLLTALQGVQSGDYSKRLTVTNSDEIGRMFLAFNQMCVGLEEGRILRSYVSTAVRESLAGSDSGNIGREARLIQATILFSTILNLPNAKSAAADPSAAAGITIIHEALNRHLLEVETAIHDCGGDIDKIIGEKILVVFRHEEFASDRAAAAAALAVAERLQSAGAGPFRLAIGLTSGTVVSGVLGAPSVRLDSTVIGDPVNLAARLVALAATLPVDPIVVSGTTRALLPPETSLVKLPVTAVKGKTQEVQAYQLTRPSPAPRSPMGQPERDQP